MANWNVASGHPVEPTPGFDTEFAYWFQLDESSGEQAELTIEWVVTPEDPIDPTAHTTVGRYLATLSAGEWPARVVVVDRKANFRVIEPDDSE